MLLFTDFIQDFHQFRKTITRELFFDPWDGTVQINGADARHGHSKRIGMCILEIQSGCFLLMFRFRSLNMFLDMSCNQNRWWLMLALVFSHVKSFPLDVFVDRCWAIFQTYPLRVSLWFISGRKIYIGFVSVLRFNLILLGIGFQVELLKTICGYACFY